MTILLGTKILLSFVQLAPTCGDPATIMQTRFQTYENGTGMPSAPTDGANWNIICLTGYKWFTGLLIQIANCSNENWQFPSACSRKSLFVWYKIVQMVTRSHVRLCCHCF